VLPPPQADRMRKHNTSIFAFSAFGLFLISHFAYTAGDRSTASGFFYIDTVLLSLFVSQVHLKTALSGGRRGRGGEGGPGGERGKTGERGETGERGTPLDVAEEGGSTMVAKYLKSVGGRNKKPWYWPF